MSPAGPLMLYKAARVGQMAAGNAASLSTLTTARTPARLPNAITLGGYALGLWWALGGPTWAGLGSIAADEVDGRLARAIDATSEYGGNLDLMVDTALVPMSLMRLGTATGTGLWPVVAAPLILAHQAALKTAGERPQIGSWRALIMASAMLAEYANSRRGKK